MALRAAKASRFHERDRQHRQDKAEHGGNDEQGTELAVVGWSLYLAGAVGDLPRNQESFVKVLRSEL